MQKEIKEILSEIVEKLHIEKEKYYKEADKRPKGNSWRYRDIGTGHGLLIASNMIEIINKRIKND